MSTSAERRVRIVREAPGDGFPPTHQRALTLLPDLGRDASAHRGATWRREATPRDDGAFERAVLQARREGLEAGFRTGFQDGLAAARAEQVAHARRVLDRIELAAADQRARCEREVERVAEEVAELAWGVVGELLGRELAIAENVVRDAVARGLSVVPDDAHLVVRLHPDDLPALDPLDPVLAGREIELVADARVERGGCVIDTGCGQVDGQLGVALARIREALGQ